MRVRVYQPPDAPVIVVFANQRLRLDDESDDAFYARIFALTEERDQRLVGLSSIDIESDQLPNEVTRLVNGEELDVRNAWRVKDGRVVVDETLIAPPLTIDEMRRRRSNPK